uniref:Uncharacterized protein n=1 Tax=Vitis vinifera TaxID=29760 RepID=F6HXU0_VITVI
MHSTTISDLHTTLPSLHQSLRFPSFPENPPIKQHRESPDSMLRLINSMLNTEEKRVKMSDAMLSAYDRELYQSKPLRQWGGGPLILLDVESLGRNCGTSCTVDGMHYDGTVYEAVVHVMLNGLLIESHQKL